MPPSGHPLISTFHRPIFNSSQVLAIALAGPDFRFLITISTYHGLFRQSERGRYPARTEVGVHRKAPSWLDYITANQYLLQSLNDFKSTSCFQFVAYGYLWVSLLISVAVYGVDTFTAVNLLAFNKWSGEIVPVIPISVSRWIFSACIIASWVNLGFEHVRAARVIKRGAVAESFLDSLAVRLQSARLGSGRGWRRFLVFAELTKSRKGAEYVALFTYFAFQCKLIIEPGRVL